MHYQFYNSIVSIATRLLTERSRVRIAVGTKDLSLLQNIQTDSGAHTASYLKSAGMLSRG